MTIAEFERDYSLLELLPGNSTARISNALKQFGLEYFEIVDLNKTALISHGCADAFESIPLILELEAIGFFQYPAQHKAMAFAAGNLIIEILQANWRYHMASSLHIEVSQQDYHTLELKNKQLENSKLRYKNLAKNLEERVKEQVKIIEDSQRKLYETEKMASIGQLAAGVAHEINNPIGFISSNLNTASEYVEELLAFIKTLQCENNKIDTRQDEKGAKVLLLEDFKELIAESASGTKRVATIVSDLKSFSNIEHVEEELVDLVDNIRLTVRIFSTSMNKKIIVDVKTQPIEKIYCKSSHINQLLLHLLNNASDAIETNGKITISCKMEGTNILLEVSDDGNGIDEVHLKRVFDPFFTTREVGAGTGLGLTVCRNIAKAHGGDIAISSQPGSGTRVQVLLPMKKYSNSDE